MVIDAIKESMDIWEQCYQHPFLEKIRTHQMEDDMFLHYLKEDTKYLMHYARVFGMGVYKSSSMSEICLFYDMLNFVESNECAARVQILKNAGYDYRDIEQEAMEKETKAYTDFLIKTAQQESVLGILYMTLPCMLSYAYIGKRLLKEDKTLIENSLYKDWIREYVCKDYQKRCAKWIEQTDALSETCSKEEWKHLKDLFYTASVHELRFWNMSYIKKG